jgi:peptide/nickel transport system permease protein
MITDAPLIATDIARAGGRWLRRDRAALFASIFLGVIAAVCLFAPVTAPYNPVRIAPFGPSDTSTMVTLKNSPPSSEHLMGTDGSSRDVLSRFLYGGRLSLGVALFATLVSVTLGTAYGAAAGYATGIASTVLERILDVLLAIPRVLLLIVIFALWEDLEPRAFVLILGMTGWYALARLVRGQVLALKTQDFVASARALGATQMRIITRHILPNVVTTVVVAAMLGVGHLIILEAGLSYLGIGIKAPDPSWGNMIREGASLGQIRSTWWISLFPGAAIVSTVIAFNVLGDALLRALSPRQSGIE